LRSSFLMPPALIFFLGFLWLLWAILCCYMHCKYFSISMKDSIGILIGVALSLRVVLSSKDTLTILILSICKHEAHVTYTHTCTCMCSSISLIHIL
jgi:ABC-type long-subunit fatty acid transport system fused permease/ATPase subunit